MIFYDISSFEKHPSTSFGIPRNSQNTCSNYKQARGVSSVKTFYGAAKLAFVPNELIELDETGRKADQLPGKSCPGRRFRGKKFRKA